MGGFKKMLTRGFNVVTGRHTCTQEKQCSDLLNLSKYMGRKERKERQTTLNVCIQVRINLRRHCQKEKKGRRFDTYAS